MFVEIEPVIISNTGLKIKSVLPAEDFSDELLATKLYHSKSIATEPRPIWKLANVKLTSKRGKSAFIVDTSNAVIWE